MCLSDGTSVPNKVGSGDIIELKSVKRSALEKFLLFAQSRFQASSHDFTVIASLLALSTSKGVDSGSAVIVGIADDFRPDERPASLSTAQPAVILASE